MSSALAGPRRRLQGIERRNDLVDVYEVTPSATWQDLCEAGLNLVAGFDPQFARLRPGVTVRLYSRAGLPFYETLAAVQGAPFEVFTVKQTWRGFVGPDEPQTIWLSQQLPRAEILPTLAHEAKHIVQLAAAETKNAWDAWTERRPEREAEADWFAYLFGHWYAALADAA